MKQDFSQHCEYHFQDFFHLCFLVQATCLCKIWHAVTRLSSAPVCDDTVSVAAKVRIAPRDTLVALPCTCYGDVPSKRVNNFNSPKLLSYNVKGDVLAFRETGLNSLVITVRKDDLGDSRPLVCFPGRVPFRCEPDTLLPS